MENSFLLQITTPSQTFFDDTVQSVVINTKNGELGILSGLAPIVAILNPGLLKIKSNNKWMEAKAGDGFVKVRNNKVEILCNKCAWVHEIEEHQEAYNYESEMQKRIQSIDEHNRTKSELIKKLSNK